MPRQRGLSIDVGVRPLAIDISPQCRCARGAADILDLLRAFFSLFCCRHLLRTPCRESFTPLWGIEVSFPAYLPVWNWALFARNELAAAVLTRLVYDGF